MQAIKEIYDIVKSDNWHKLTSLEKDDMLQQLKEKKVSISGVITDVSKAYSNQFIINVDSLLFKTRSIYERSRSIYEDGPAIEYQESILTKKFTFKCLTTDEKTARQCITLKDKNIEIDGTIISVTPPYFDKDFSCEIKIKEVKAIEKIWMTQDLFEIPYKDKSLREYERDKRFKEEQAKRRNELGCSGIIKIMMVLFIAVWIWAMYRTC